MLLSCLPLPILLALLLLTFTSHLRIGSAHCSMASPIEERSSTLGKHDRSDSQGSKLPAEKKGTGMSDHHIVSSCLTAMLWFYAVLISQRLPRRAQALSRALLNYKKTFLSRIWRRAAWMASQKFVSVHMLLL